MKYRYCMRVDRIIIYPKDVQRITGKSERYGRMLLKRIKDHLQKDDHQFVSVEEFCAYTGLRNEQVTEFLLA
jgi:hypothetical protein